MAEVSISIDRDQFSCSVCLDLLKNPVTIPCGHSFCIVCINGHWDQEDQRGVYSCPQCRETFTPRPVLRRNNMVAEVVEKLKKTEVRAASRAHCYAGAGDVECDFCTGRKLKAIKSCLVCVASLCETHLKPHLEIPALMKHKLVKASTRLQEKICSQHDKLIEIYCRTDQQLICYLCAMHEHKGHDTVAATAEEKQKIQEKEKNLQKLKPTLNAVKSAAEELLEQLEQEITDLKKRNTELEQLSHTEDHIHFFQSFESLSVSSGSDQSPNISVRHHVSFDAVIRSVSDLKKKLEKETHEEKISRISPHAAAVQVFPSEPKTREDFLQYFCQLTLDPNTAYGYLILSKDYRKVKYVQKAQQYPDHPERFENFFEVLSKESVSGRCYWEVEWSSKKWVAISVSYKGISRKGSGDECKFGHNDQSWSLRTSSPLSFWYNNIETKISAPPSSRIGVYVDHSAGTLSFYSVSDTMTLLHTVHTTFTQPLYAGFWLSGTESVAELCNGTSNISHSLGAPDLTKV
ncbi:E3 ubiquitin/ISG15 ligase TRIM25-like isoform X5 [Astyanax mexicanus]|uniref:E3 ubiquitin/ISG15 ligase TRIM25-like isoform X5 n=1 Tax=Astyanax mexicanus TaxID=7994 RepID=UPI0020CB1F9E|nr:E3 ubiquitin/ISG15 ligase TRIM25-like isoform X5 [Astyanax mexicanus]